MDLIKGGFIPEFIGRLPVSAVLVVAKIIVAQRSR